jgi:hypothetical protein
MEKVLEEKALEASELASALEEAKGRAVQFETYVTKIGELTDVLSKKTNQVKTLAAEASLQEWKALDYQKKVEVLQQQVKNLKMWRRRHASSVGPSSASSSAVGAHTSGVKAGPSRISSSSSSKRKVAFIQASNNASTESSPPDQQRYDT